MSPTEEIQAKLGEVRDRIRRVQLTRGLLVTATIALAGLLLIMAADYFFAPLPGVARWVMFILWVVAMVYAAKIGFALYFRKIGLVQIARWIEARHPEIQERMSTVLELADQKNAGSSDLIAALGLAAHQDIGTVNPELEIKSGATKKKWARPAIAMAAILVIVLVIWPKQSGRLLVRAVAPFSDLGNAGAASFGMAPGNIEVLEGDPVTITVTYEGAAKTIDLWITQDGGKAFSQTLTRSGKNFTYELNPAVQSFRYFAQSGRAQSDAYKVTVLPIPKMIAPRLAVEYLEYTGLAKRTVNLGNGFEEVEGTKVTLTSPTNTAIESAWVEVEGKRLSNAKLETSTTGGRVSFSWTLSRENSGLAIITAEHRLGREIEFTRFTIVVLPDIDPQVRLNSPSPEEIKVRFDEQVPLRYAVAEDFSVSKLMVEVDAGGDNKTIFAEDLPIRVPGRTKPPVFDGTAIVSVGKIRSLFQGVSEARVRITATDNRPADLSSGPGVGSSRWLTLKFDQNAESLGRQELREEHEGAREKIEEAIREVREAKDQLASLEGEVRKDKMENWAQEKFEKANQKLAKTQKKIEALAQQMEESIHAKKAKEVEKAAQKIEEALARSEAAPLQDDADKRQQGLQQAREFTEEALKNLEQVRNEINQDQRRVEDLARFQELAQKQQELARQAEENLQQPMTAEQLADWKRQQEQMEQQLAEQLKQRPDALAEAFAEQAKQAEQFAQEAQKLAENQAELQQQAEQSATSEALEQALANEQKSIANEAQAQLDQALQDQSEMADTLPEATAAANEALAEIQKNEPAAAAESAQKAAQALDKSAVPEVTPRTPTQAAQSEALAELSDRQQQVADTLDALAKGNLTEALEAVQSMQAHATAQLAENLDSLPQIDPSGQMQQATQSSAQAAQSAESAAQQAAQGQQQNAAPQHAQASQKLQQTAQQLTQAAQSMAQVPEAAAQQAADSQKAPVSPQDLAAAAADAAKAASSDQQAQSAESAQQAAQNLASAAQSARSKMSGKPSPPGPPGMPGLPQMPGDQPSMDSNRPPLPDPGVPPELAKLGISAGDWEKIQATLISDKSGAGIEGVPAEYRGLVKSYFQSMSQK